MFNGSSTHFIKKYSIKPSDFMVPK